MQRTSFRSMGTDVELVGPVHDAFTLAARAVEATFVREDARFSRFHPRSELSHVNRHAGEPTEISPTFATVTRLALDAAERTAGLFDPTLLDAIVAAGYDRDLDELLAGARVALRPGRPGGGWREIGLDGSTIELPAGVGLDLGGIVKGWTADVAADVAVATGLPWALVNAGGDLRLAGDAPELDIAVEDPHDAPASIGTLRVSHGGVATSSVTKRAWGAGLHHLIDPTTGSPTRGDVVQATVCAPTCAEAEVLAKVVVLDGVDALERVSGVVVTRHGTVATSLGAEVAA
jgi:thiamine biosynthesis lipoprotein